MVRADSLKACGESFSFCLSLEESPRERLSLYHCTATVGKIFFASHAK
jgi:hypothetical protein